MNQVTIACHLWFTIFYPSLFLQEVSDLYLQTRILFKFIQQRLCNCVVQETLSFIHQFFSSNDKNQHVLQHQHKPQLPQYSSELCFKLSFGPLQLISGYQNIPTLSSQCVPTGRQQILFCLLDKMFQYDMLRWQHHMLLQVQLYGIMKTLSLDNLVILFGQSSLLSL